MRTEAQAWTAEDGLLASRSHDPRAIALLAGIIVLPLLAGLALSLYGPMLGTTPFGWMTVAGVVIAVGFGVALMALARPSELLPATCLAGGLVVVSQLWRHVYDLGDALPFVVGGVAVHAYAHLIWLQVLYLLGRSGRFNVGALVAGGAVIIALTVAGVWAAAGQAYGWPQVAGTTWAWVANYSVLAVLLVPIVILRGAHLLRLARKR